MVATTKCFTFQLQAAHTRVVGGGSGSFRTICCKNLSFEVIISPAAHGHSYKCKYVQTNETPFGRNPIIDVSNHTQTNYLIFRCKTLWTWNAVVRNSSMEALMEMWKWRWICWWRWKWWWSWAVWEVLWSPRIRQDLQCKAGDIYQDRSTHSLLFPNPANRWKQNHK